MTTIVRLTFDRASVAMGDDVDSHREFFEYPSACTVDDFLVDASTRLLPSVRGPAGWSVQSDPDDPHRRRTLGLVYTRDDLGAEDLVCRLLRDGLTLGHLARGGELTVYAHYLTWGAARPVSLGEVRSGPWFNGIRGESLGSEAAAQALVDWQRVRDTSRDTAAVAVTRRAWIRDTLLSGDPLPAGVDAFTANNFHHLTTLHCPASMRIVGQLVGAEDGIDTGTAVVTLLGDARTATLGMVLAAFEYGTERETWRLGERDYCTAYFEFLVECGYALHPVERAMAGLPE